MKQQFPEYDSRMPMRTLQNRGQRVVSNSPVQYAIAIQHIMNSNRNRPNAHLTSHRMNIKTIAEIHQANVK